MKEQFEMVAKTFQGLEEVLAEELRGLGAERVEPGRRMVSFYGDLEMLYRANLCCRTALRILKPVYKFTARDTDELYDRLKEFDWGELMSVNSTFSIDTVAYGDDFTNSRFVTYRVKDAIADWFRDRYDDQRPGVRLDDADVRLNVYISGQDVSVALDSSGESLHKRGYRVAQTEAPINEVLAAGIILRSGWRGDSPLVDPMCGSGTFLIEAALIAANINPGVYRRHFSFENWKDFDAELFDQLYNDDSQERDFHYKIYGSDISPKAIEIAEKNIKSAGVAKMIDLQIKPLSAWSEAPEGGVLITNPPYGERISVDDMEGLYSLLGSKLKNVFKGYHAWVIGYRDEYFAAIGLAPSEKVPILNGSLECELREYVIFEGDYKSFRREGGSLREIDDKKAEKRQAKMEERRRERRSVMRDVADLRDNPRGDRKKPGPRKPFDRDRKPFDRDRKPFRKPLEELPDDMANDLEGAGEVGRERTFAEKRRETRESRAGAPRNKLEERYRPKGPRKFGEDRPPRKFDNERPPRKFGEDRPPRKFDNDRPPRQPEKPSENPLAVRRNENALKSIVGKQPTLPSQQGPLMRDRKNPKK